MITKKEAMKDYYDEGYSHGYVDGYKKAELDYAEEMKKRKRKTGHWELTHDFDNNPNAIKPLGRVIRCSECGYPENRLATNFCPKCGADMRGEQDE